MLIRIPKTYNEALLEDIEKALPPGVSFITTSSVKATKRSYAFRGVLRCDTSRNPHARRSASGRRTIAADWETHRIFLAALFDAWPEAVVRTSLATYRGRDDFMCKHPETAHNPMRVPGDPYAIVPFSAL